MKALVVILSGDWHHKRDTGKFKRRSCSIRSNISKKNINKLNLVSLYFKQFQVQEYIA